MTSEIPKKHSQGNSHVFIGLAAVMLVATGGLILWKVTNSPSESTEAAAVTAVPTVEEERLRFAPPPPPPPPEETPSASASVEAPSNSALRPAKSPCSGECNGEATAALKSALAGRGGAGRRCYEKALGQNATLSGKMTIHLKISPGGQVCAASVVNDTLQEPRLNNCILGVFRASQLPAPQGGCVEVDVPLNFVQNK